MWEKFTDSLLYNRNISIPIEKRFFLSFVEDDENNINKKKIFQILNKNGYLEDDPRLKKFINNLKILVSGDNVKYEEFEHCVENHICILKKILQNESIIPQFGTFTNIIDEIYEESKKEISGKNADYIPQLSRINPEQFGRP